MLRLMRDKFKTSGPLRMIGLTVLWGVILSFVLLIFIGWGLGGVSSFQDPSGEPTDRSAAIDVDGRVVSRADFYRQLRNTQENIRRQFGDQADQLMATLNLRDQVAQSLISRQLALREANRAGLKVTDSEVRDYIVRSFVDAEGNFVGRERVERLVRGQGYSPDQFRQVVADDLLAGKMQRLVEAGAVATEAEVRAEYLRRNDSAQIEYVLFDPLALAPAAAATEAELRAFYGANKSRFETEQRRARYVLFPAHQYAGEGAVSDEELRKAYDERERFGLYGEKRRVRHILLKTAAGDADPLAAVAVEDKARALAERARKGEAFETLAQQNSEDATTAIKGGDLGFFGRNAMVKPFEEAVFDPAVKPGDIIGPVRTTYGFHIIRLEEIQAGRTLEQARPELEKLVRERNGRSAARAAAQKAIDQHKTDANLAAIATEANRPALESGLLRDDGKGGELPEVTATLAPAVARALFGIPEVGKLAAEPVSLGADFAVLQLADRQGPIVPPFEEVRDRVEQELRRERGQAVVKARLDLLRAALAKGSTLADAATAATAELQATRVTSRTGPLPGMPASEALVKAAWELPAGTVSEPIDVAGKTAVVRVAERFSFDEGRYAAEKDTVRDELERGRKSEVWTSLLGASRKELEGRGRIQFLAQDLLREPTDQVETE